jgi:hypothetical protein
MLEAGIWRGAAGARAQLKYAYQTAAELTDYQIAWKAGTLGARIAWSDPFVLTQSPLVLVVPTKYGAAKWPIDSFDVQGDRLTARLGAMLKGT